MILLHNWAIYGLFIGIALRTIQTGIGIVLTQTQVDAHNNGLGAMLRGRASLTIRWPMILFNIWVFGIVGWMIGIIAAALWG